MPTATQRILEGQEEEIRFGGSDKSDPKSEDIQAGYTRAGTSFGIEVAAAAINIQENYNQETCHLGTDEAQIAELHIRDRAMEQDKFILFSLTKQEKLYTSTKRAFGYKNKNN